MGVCACACARVYMRACVVYIRPCSDDLLELYCGFGHNTVALAPFFRTVLAERSSVSRLLSSRTLTPYMSTLAQ